jgi:uncharacterized phage-associated protein
LDEADQIGRPLTNLALQKLLYFVHGLFLVETKNPLVSGFFEAWTYGPVNPTAYKAFKTAGANPISFRASIRDPFTDDVITLPECADVEAVTRIRRIVCTYGSLTPGRLVELSHAKNAPWAYIVDKARTQTVLGLRIADDVIRERFRFHKVSIGGTPRYGEPREDAPLV